jgi:hypothetical protein
MYREVVCWKLFFAILNIYYILRFKRWRFCGLGLDIWRSICVAYLLIHIVKY